MVSLAIGLYYIIGENGILIGISASFSPYVFGIIKGFKKYSINFSLIKEKAGFLNEVYFNEEKFPFYRTPFVINRILDQNSNEGSKIEQNNNKIISNWQNNWLDLCELGNQKGFKIFVVVQPLIGTGNKILSSHESKYLNNSKSDVIEIIYGLTTQLEILETTCSGTADFTNALDEISEPIFYDQGHMNDHGNEIIAEKFFNLLNPILK